MSSKWRGGYNPWFESQTTSRQAGLKIIDKIKTRRGSTIIWLHRIKGPWMLIYLGELELYLGIELLGGGGRSSGNAHGEE